MLLVCVCVCVYVLMCVNIHVRDICCLCVYVCVFMCLCVYIYTCVTYAACVSMCVFVYVCVCVYIHVNDICCLCLNQPRQACSITNYRAVQGFHNHVLDETEAVALERVVDTHRLLLLHLHQARAFVHICTAMLAVWGLAKRPAPPASGKCRVG